MKELSIEQKAKCYDEAIKKARIWKDKSGMPKDKQGILDDIFPELAESEDEKIRKAILKHFEFVRVEERLSSCFGVDIHTIIAWLEKQEAIDILDEKEREFADNVDSYRKEIDAAYQTGYNEGVKATLENQCEQVYDKNLSKLLNKVICRFINDSNIPYSERDEVSKKIIPYVERLEKQGEQKPAWSEEDEDKNESPI